MKRFLLPVAVAAICGLPQAAAISADYAQAELTMKPSDAQVEQVVPRAEYFTTKDTNKAISPAWHYVRIPYTLLGRCRESGKTPLYVDELKVHAYLVFSVGGKDSEKLILVDKEITYVNIPLAPKGNESENKNVQAAVFISPSDAARICGAATNRVDKVDLAGKLAAVAVEFQFKGADCSKPEAEADVLVNKKMKNRLKAGWWKKEGKNDIGVELRAISETPFAPFYAPTFPATNPMYGSAGSSASSSPLNSVTGNTGYTPTPSMDTTTTTDTSADTENSSSSSKKNKKRRNKK